MASPQLHRDKDQTSARYFTDVTADIELNDFHHIDRSSVDANIGTAG